MRLLLIFKFEFLFSIYHMMVMCQNKIFDVSHIPQQDLGRMIDPIFFRKQTDRSFAF